MNIPHAHSPLQAKRQLRRSMLSKRQQYPAAARAEAALSVAQHFADHPILAFKASIAGYRSIRAEIDVMPIFGAMARYAKQTSLPVTPAQHDKDGHIAFYPWKAGNPLTKDRLGVETPELSEGAEPIIPELILVPLLAFDSAGFRLGYGGGFYDRTLAHYHETLAQPPLTIGVGYNFQEVEQLPIEPHDMPLDGILTETGVSMF